MAINASARRSRLEHVLKRDGTRCHYCNNQCVPFDPLLHPTIDHMEPKSKKPELEKVYRNMVLACKLCNYIKMDKDYVDFRQNHFKILVRIVDKVDASLKKTLPVKSPKTIKFFAKHFPEMRVSE